jgi:hypothetical protein
VPIIFACWSFYSDFYLAIKSWGRYEVVATPAEADLILETSFVMLQVSVNDALRLDPTYKLTIIDPRTHVVLWAFFEHVKRALLPGTVGKNFENARTKMMLDLKLLCADPSVKSESAAPSVVN